MENEEKYEYWLDYVTKNGNGRKTVMGGGVFAWAPYKCGAVVLNDVHQFVFFTKSIDNFLYWHRLDGPAVVQKDGIHKFWIEDKRMEEGCFLKHPLRVEAIMDSLIKEILND